VENFGTTQKTHITQRLLPTTKGSKKLDSYEQHTFCGRFSKDGNIFMSACQDRRIRLYNTTTWKPIKEIAARDVGWSIIDTDYSPDQRWLIYSSWSDCVHYCNIYGDHEVHEPLDMKPQSHRFCLFSINFSHDSREILGGSSDNCLYIYDLDRRQRISRIEGHTEDINTVKFADSSSQILISGSDDCLIKIWDRRTCSQSGCVGVLSGHFEGITHIDVKGDGHYFISNSKDQTIKLWDIRHMTDKDKFKPNVRRTHWDYRDGEFFSQNQRRIFSGKTAHPNDQSIMTYRGHRVFQTLIRCYFSPEVTTGQRYIYTGSYDGNIYIYDVLTGALVDKLTGHRATVRDVSWHPTEPVLISASWDGTCRIWRADPDSLKQK